MTVTRLTDEEKRRRSTLATLQVIAVLDTRHDNAEILANMRRRAGAVYADPFAGLM